MTKVAAKASDNAAITANHGHGRTFSVHIILPPEVLAFTASLILKTYRRGVWGLYAKS
jgi:hypothetical protein